MLVRGIADADIDVLRLACAYGLRHTAPPKRWPESPLWAEEVSLRVEPTVLTEEDVARAEELWRQGVPAREIARRLGFRLHRIYSLVNNHRDRFPYRYRTRRVIRAQREKEE